MQLEERPSILLNQLIYFKKTNFPQLMEHTQLSKRQITYDLEKINYWLTHHDLPTIVYKRAQWIEIPEAILQHVDKCCAVHNKERFYFSEDERLIAVYLFLFIRKEPISSIHLTSLLNVSKNTVLSDIKKVNTLIAPHLVSIRYTRQAGYHLRGTELDKRTLLMNFVSKLLVKPNGEKMVTYILKKAEQPNELERMLDIMLKLERTYKLYFVEERLQHFVYFLQFYSLRLQQRKWVSLHQDEIDVLKQDDMKEISRQLLIELHIEEQPSELSYLIIQLLGLSLGNASCSNEKLDLLIGICDQLVSQFEQTACVTFQNKKQVVTTLYEHFKPAYYRMKYRIPINNPFLKKIQTEHKDLYTIVKGILVPIAQLLNIVIPEEEIGFITIHFGALLKTPEKVSNTTQKAIVICPSGVSSSLMVKHELELLFPEIHFSRTKSLQQFLHDGTKDDLIFSTVPLPSENAYFLVKPIMTEIEKENLVDKVYETLYGRTNSGIPHTDILQLISQYAAIFDKQGLQNALAQLSFHKPTKNLGRYKPMLQELITADKIQIVDSVPTWEDAISLVAKPLVEQQIIEPSYIDGIIDTVNKLGPYIVIGPEFALPHARPEMGVNKVGMSLLKLNKPVDFSDDGSKPVRLLICLAAVDNTTHLKALSQLTKLLSNSETFEALKNVNTVDEVIELLEHQADAA
ncbi:MAG: BglG family transcription antiterminator [Bacillus sp. (in: firmicutes)]